MSKITAKPSRYFDQAIQLDPNYALAYAERSEVWTMIGDLTGERATAYPKARSDAEKAVEIAPALAEAHAALGWVRFFVEWKFAEGLSELKRAKELSPANPTANDLLARVIVYLGRIDEAERQARAGGGTRPACLLRHNSTSARVLFFAGKLDEADAAARKAAELQPTSSSSHRWQVLVAVQRGDGEAALREAQLEPDEDFRRFELVIAHYVRGDRKAVGRGFGRPGRPLAERAWTIKSPKLTPCEARQTKLSNGCKSRSIITTAGRLVLPVDPLLRGLHDDPRYKNLLAKLGLPGPIMSDKPSLFSELKRRNVYKVAVDLCGRGVAADSSRIRLCADARCARVML